MVCFQSLGRRTLLSQQKNSLNLLHQSPSRQCRTALLLFQNSPVNGVSQAGRNDKTNDKLSFGHRNYGSSRVQRQAETDSGSTIKDTESTKLTATNKTYFPTLAVARTMPSCPREISNDVLLAVALTNGGSSEAWGEVLKRHIMAVDNVEYEEAEKTFKLIDDSNRWGTYLYTTPNKIGMTLALTAGFASFPLCFHLDLVAWFNEHYVTADVPPLKDLETSLEVGSWAWNWMEPPLGQISFFLLCLQFARSQIQNLGLRPFSDKVKQMRAERLCEEFPQYDVSILTNFSRSISYYN